jgi:hypothetical protein
MGFELWRRRDAVSLLLALWLGGGLLFATVLNWTVSARSFLPLVPAAAILVVRGLGWRRSASEQQEDCRGRRKESSIYEAAKGGKTPYVVSYSPLPFFWPIAISAAVSVMIAVADYSLANSGRDAARTLVARHANREHLWFQGHRGFQYYMEKAGTRPVDLHRTVLQPGDLLVIPSNSNNLSLPSDGDVEPTGTYEFEVCSWLSTVHAATGAGFYGATGLLPFVFGPVPTEQYFVLRVLRPLCFAPPELLNNRAWQLATSSDPKSRDGTLAVQLAQRACELTRFETTIYIGTLAAALAEAGRFDDAVATAQKACLIAAKNGETNLLRRNEELMEQYRQHRAVRE